AAGDAKPYAWQAGARAIEDHLQRSGTPATVKRALKDFYQVEYQTDERPTISIIIPSAFKKNLLLRCVHSILSKSSYPNFQIVLVVSEETAVSHKGQIEGLASDVRVRFLVHQQQSFNYAAVNNLAVRQTDSDIICLLNDDIEVITSDWLEKLAARLALPGVGVVGPLL